MIWRNIKRLSLDISEVLFPVCCLVCGIRQGCQHYLCELCLDQAFEPAGLEEKESMEGVVLPDWLSMQYILWKYDKGGYLQESMHQLKYGGLTGLGYLLGQRLGYGLIKNQVFSITQKTVLLPVPLHPSRKRRRGYNQARCIAEGVASVLPVKIIEERAVVRMRNTKTQTGFNAEKRKKNMEGVFRVIDSCAVQDKDVIIIDDVITTGATSMELAGILRKTAGNIGVAAIARA
ncbi:ComF family protein [Balneolaceae bacterium ANBcel3]|nr:ComF family protein [Balneolaceae bacterium ANBcel3]